MVGKRTKEAFLGIFIFVVTLSVLFFANFVMAAITIGDYSAVELPASGTNHSGAQSGSFVVNMTFLNSSVDAKADMNGTGSLFNATFYYNDSATNWIIIGNSTN